MLIRREHLAGIADGLLEKMFDLLAELNFSR